MFYFFSKLLDFMIMPYCLMLWGLVAILFFIKQTKIRVFIGIIALFFYLQSNTYLVAQLYKLWEWPAQNKTATGKTYDFGIVLSGGLLGAYSPIPEYFDLERGSDRLLTGYFLYKKGICRKLLLTGADHPNLIAQGRGEVQLAKKLLMEWGVPDEAILLETKARNTYENALFVASMLEGEPAQDLLLVTSAYHMRRSIGCFTKVGLRTDPFPSDFFISPDHLPLKYCLTPDPKASEAFQKLWREWVGMIAYKMAGYR